MNLSPAFFLLAGLGLWALGQFIPSRVAGIIAAVVLLVGAILVLVGVS